MVNDNITPIIKQYKDYMYFTDNTWDFENVIKVNKEFLLKILKCMLSIKNG